jgi:hypothetical protein
MAQEIDILTGVSIGKVEQIFGKITLHCKRLQVDSAVGFRCILVHQAVERIC